MKDPIVLVNGQPTFLGKYIYLRDRNAIVDVKDDLKPVSPLDVSLYSHEFGYPLSISEVEDIFSQSIK